MPDCTRDQKGQKNQGRRTHQAEPATINKTARSIVMNTIGIRLRSRLSAWGLYCAVRHPFGPVPMRTVCRPSLDGESALDWIRLALVWEKGVP